MRFLAITFVLCLLYVTPSVVGQEGCKCRCGREEPFLKFWDDLRSFPHGTCERDPYEERLETERHDFTQTTRTVGRGVIQVETGYSYFFKDNEEEIEQSHTLPETLVRIGLSDDVEFRVRWTYAWRFIDEGEHLDSAQDIIWSIKLGLTEECGWIPESALEIRSSVPSGGAEWSLQRVEAGFDYIAGWELAEGIELSASVGVLPGGLGDFSLLPDEPLTDRFLSWSSSVALGLELTERATFYSEWYGLFSYALEENFSISIFNVGLDYYLSDNFVVDLRAGTGLTDDSDDLFTGIGGGYRF